VRSPLRFSDAELALGRASPRLGEHTDELRREVGLAPAGGGFQGSTRT